jgi:hypothetical protein
MAANTTPRRSRRSPTGTTWPARSAALVCGITLQPNPLGPLAASPCANPISDACPSRGKGEARVARLNVRLAVAGPRRERPALKLAPLENRVVLLDEGAGSLPVVGGLAAVDVVGRLEV